MRLAPANAAIAAPVTTPTSSATPSHERQCAPRFDPQPEPDRRHRGILTKPAASRARWQAHPPTHTCTPTGTSRGRWRGPTARPAPRRSTSIVSGETGESVASTMSAASPLGLRPTSMSEMLTLASPSTLVTRPIIPGVVGVVHHEHVARGRQVDRVLVDADDPRRLVLAEQRARGLRGAVADRAAHLDRGSRSSRASADFVSRTEMPRSSASCGAFTKLTGSSTTGPSTPFRIESVSTRQS